MSAMSSRIRKCRAVCALSQSELARRIGVNRSAVTQWEQLAGTLPSVEHLIQIAVVTGSSFEWIATGRGPFRSSADAEPAVITGDYALDSLESSALTYLRSMIGLKKRIAIQVLEVLAR